TGRAERFAHWINKAYFTDTITKGIAASSFRRIACGDWHEWSISSLNNSFDLAPSQDILFAPDLISIKWHELDPAHNITFSSCKLYKVEDFIFAEPTYGDRVDLDRMDGWIFLHLFKALQYTVKLIASCEFCELFANE